ncbi:SGNH/GDSL hydrolase family protein [Polaribacter reichenbachii]|uniref:SGNH hydrolase-type esterase domain-containing protein n=1 Tax=Polaribacter reichenbachii TaxID=996801 RepID=A0A1B8TNR4_9FLAO|nr:SGNH/GDSL hydrolase family protein [Polaribacter reichenbachii]APZ46667.1 SGNH/GDSL hydrolase family protein [Polaribacter reichenbachii]AUC17310.1 SGNH/GDSL hydrolase family protein [Polaribacter reichenbachii]OBY61242.1 hypothetical protein LPB301_17395 [Polaribacter reichenbachii]
MKNKLIFKFIALSLPLILIFILELILGIFNYGENYNLFNKITSENNTEYLVMNSGISKKYFKNTGFNSDNQSDLFLREKTENTFRVFIQGASTVVGFPFYKNGSFPRILKHRLSLTFPDKNIEIINTGITAVNSYTLWDLSDKIIAQKPDLVIIYAGHNEYYGALGVGSSISIGNYPAIVRSYLKLKNFRFFQLFENGYSKVFKPNEKSKYTVKETTLMEVMAKEQQIPYNSDVYNAGINQFKSNINKALDKYASNNIPVILSTVISNKKDIKPFISDDFNENKFDKNLKSNKSEAFKTANSNAKAAYKMGQFYLNKQQDSAKKYFHLAKELDMLRFRAPEKVNDIIINELSKKQGVYLLDSRKAMQKKSKSGFIDNDVLTEHVHPNVKGNFILADAFYNKIKEIKILDNWNHFISYDEAFNDISITRIDSIKGKFIVQDLKNSWPYKLNMSGTNPIAQYNYILKPTYEEKKAINLYAGREEWQNVMREAYHTYNNNKDYKNALKVAQSLISEFPEQTKVYEMAREICLKMNNRDYANYYSKKINQLKQK